MAKLHQLSVQQALNSQGVGGQWTVNTVSTIHSGTGVTNTVHLPVSGAAQLGVIAGEIIYFNFSTTTTDCNTSNDLEIPADTLVFLTVPQGLGSTIYFNHLGKTVCTVRTVEI